MNSGNEEIDRAVADWDHYNSTPYAPYVSLPDYIGMTLEEWDRFLQTGEVPRNWEWD
jgi:hypothetical protein